MIGQPLERAGDLSSRLRDAALIEQALSVLLLEPGDGQPLMLQVKQANDSVLEPYLGASQFANAGERVVVGQRVMQAAGDPFLGWTKGSKKSPQAFYVRQLKDQKASIEVALLAREGLSDYGQLCGAILARAHARGGGASTIAGYLGETDEFDVAVVAFSMAYAAINSSDHAALVESIVSG